MNSRFRLMCVWGVADPSFASHHFKKDSDAPDPNPGLLKQAEISEALGNRSLDIYEAQNARNEARYDELMPLYKQVIDAQLGQMDSQSKLAEDYDAYNKTTFRPLEQRIVRDSEEFDSVANQEAAAGRAGADVIAAYDRNRTNLTRSMTGLGVNMASPAAIAAMKDMTIDQAGAEAGAQNRAREQVKTIGRAMRMDASNLGRNLPSNQATSASLAVNAGNAATGNAAQQSQGYLAGNQAAQSWFNAGVGAHGQAGNIYAQEFNARMNGWNAQNQANAAESAGIGSAIGTFAGLAFGASDENLKTDKRPVDEDAALEAIEKTGVGAWRYKPGVADEGEHVGPMAQDVRKNMGEAAAPGGKVIDLVSANGTNMLGIKALAKRVKKLERFLDEGEKSNGKKTARGNK